MRRTGVLLLAGLLFLAGCAGRGKEPELPGYQQIDQETAGQMMEQEDGHVVVDVRRLDEYEAGHIPGAICLPNEDIGAAQPAELPNLQQTILLYCRTGNRSRQAAEKLVRLGYTKVYEFGGIVDWTGEVVTGQTLTLTLESNPTTGYSWAAAQDLELLDIRSFYVAEPQSEPISGAGGWQTFILTPKQPGTVRLSLAYSRPWEPGGAEAQLAYTLEISEDLTITVIEDGSAEAAEQGYAPVVIIYGT